MKVETLQHRNDDRFDLDKPVYVLDGLKGKPYEFYIDNDSSPWGNVATNAEQIVRVRQIIEGLGLEVATPTEAREILALKGGDRIDILTEHACGLEG